MAFQRTESTFAPLPDGTYTMSVTEAAIRIASTGNVGVNVKLRVNELDENGQPQQGAGRSLFNTYYMSEKSVGQFCEFLDMCGFRTDDNKNYLLDDNSEMPDPSEMENEAIVPFLVGRTFVTKYSSKEEEWNGKPQTRHNVRAVRANGKIITSVHPHKTAVFAGAAPAVNGGGVPQSGSPAPFGGGF